VQRGAINGGLQTSCPKTVPAGTFDDCYELTNETRKGEQKRWVCAGVGVVAYEYPGEEAGRHYRIELMDFMISEGPVFPHRSIFDPQYSIGSKAAF
jgi:hypothetical protein